MVRWIVVDTKGEREGRETDFYKDERGAEKVESRNRETERGREGGGKEGDLREIGKRGSRVVFSFIPSVTVCVTLCLLRSVCG